MTGDRKIVGLWPATDADTVNVAADVNSADTAPISMQVEDDTALDCATPDDAAGFRPILDGRMRWAGIVVGAGGLLWIVSTVWLATTGFSALPGPADVASLIADLAPPILLLGLAWMVGMRVSHRHVAEQLQVLQNLRREHLEFEDQLAAMQTQWRIADDQLRERAQGLASYGLDTVGRLAEAGSAIEASMQSCATSAGELSTKSEVAHRHLDSLAIAIPRVEEVTTRLSENLRQAGLSAYQYGGQLEARIASIGVEAATTGAALVESEALLGQRVASMNAATEAASKTFAEGIAHLEIAAQQHRDRALILLAEFAASANETTTQSASEISTARATLHGMLDSDICALRDQLQSTADVANAMQAALDGAIGRSAGLHETLTTTTDDAQQRIAALEQQAGSRFAALHQAITLLGEAVNGFQSGVQATDENAVTLIQRAETLLIALDSAKREIDETVPDALLRLHSHATEAGQAVAALAPLAEGEAHRIAAIKSDITAMGDMLNTQQQGLNSLSDQGRELLSEREQQVAVVSNGIANLQERLALLTEGEAATLNSKLADIEAEATASVTRTEAAIERLVTTASTRAAADLSAAIDRAAGEGVNERLESMSALADQAVAAASAASDRLMRQLITIADSSAALEQQAQQVQALSATVERETLARQMALLGEALNSTAVDLTRIIDIDVADQAWDSYLKGDRSIFTRRAARLLTSAEAREILRRYEQDEVFKGLVNRYIHDFETMLRGIMDTRDGDALSVTLLSSDIGKLYVALAQSIERLRR